MSEGKRRLPDFRIKYIYRLCDDFKEFALVNQGLRSDWIYAENYPRTFDPATGEKWFSMIWPRFVDEDGLEYSEWESIPIEGFADMYIFSPESKQFHRKFLRVGTKGFLVRGPVVLADAEVIDLLYLNHDSTDNP